MTQGRKAVEETGSLEAEAPRNWETMLKLQEWQADFALTPSVFWYHNPCYSCICMLEKWVLVIRGTMISSEESQLLSLFSVTHTAGPGEPVLMHVKSLFLIFCFCNMTYCYTTSSWGGAVWRTSVAVTAVRVLPPSDVSALICANNWQHYNPQFLLQIPFSLFSQGGVG